MRLKLWPNGGLMLGEDVGPMVRCFPMGYRFYGLAIGQFTVGVHRKTSSKHAKPWELELGRQYWERYGAQHRQEARDG